MNTNLDDPRLTAYALGELTGDDLAAVEKILAADPAARQLVDAVRQTALRLEAELSGEECPSLTPQQTRAIEQKIGARQPAVAEPRWWTRQWIPGFRLLEMAVVMALIAVLAAMLLPALSKSKNKARHIAMLNEQRQQALAMSVSANPPATLPPPAPMMPEAYATSLQRPQMALPSSSQTALNYQLDGSVVGQGGSVPLQGVGTVGSANKVSGHQTQMRASQVLTVINGFSFSQNSTATFASGTGDYDDSKSSLYRRVQSIPPSGQPNTEVYASVTDNPFLAAVENPLSTFSIDVDTASYANVRRFLTGNQLPPPDAVRIEELINYFSYNYPQPKGNVPFSVNAEVAGCPWNTAHRLVRIGLKGREIARDQRPASNLVFLIDVSGSMDEPDKLPLLKESLKLLTRQLDENDHVAIVVYAGAAGMVLPETSGRDKATILDALDRLSAGGSTHGSAGIQLAYQTAAENFIQGGVNRVILCTDGDFNVGVTSEGELTRLIQEKAQSKIFLSVLGFGTGNYKDSTMEMLADKGNGNYAYIDSLNEGRKVLVEQMSGTLVTIAKDVKIQVEFNPAQVNSYRLIGYENRLLAKEDFNNDKKDAGEIGAGHTVTALYEVVPAGQEPEATPGVDPLKYQKPVKPSRAANSDELLTLKLRYKQPDGDTSRLLTTVIKDTDKSYNRASTDFKFAAAVAEFGMVLRGSPYKGDADLNSAWEHAKANVGKDPEGYRAEFLTMIEQAQRLAGK